MSNINVNSRVRIGNGKVEYTVFAITEKGFNLQDDKGRNRYDVPADKLTVLSSPEAEVVEEASSPEVEKLSLSTHNMKAESLDKEKVFVILDGEEPVEYKSFDAAAFAVSRNHEYVFATIVNRGGVTVQRKRVA